MKIKTVRLLTSALLMSSTALLISCGGGSESSADLDSDNRVDFDTYAAVRDFNPDTTSDNVDQLVASVNRLGFDAFKSGNPYDDNRLTVAEARVNTTTLLLAGSSGQTEAYLLDSLGLSLSSAQIDVAMNRLDLTIRENNLDAIWGRSRAAWGQSKYLFSLNYLEQLVEEYGMGLYAADFRGESSEQVVEDVQQAATNWAQDRSKSRANWPLSFGSIDARSRIVLAESQHQDLTWSTPCTTIEDGRFELLSEYQISTPLISCTGWMGRYQGDNFIATNIPLTDSSLELLVVVPGAGKFADVASRVGSDLLTTIYRELNYLESQVTFPALHLSQSIDLLYEQKHELGEENADLSAVNGWGYLFVNAWQLNAQFEITASGITGGITSGLALIAEKDELGFLFIDEPINGSFTFFMVNDSMVVGTPLYVTPPQALPTIFILRDSITGVVVMISQVTKPAGAEITADSYSNGFIDISIATLGTLNLTTPAVLEESVVTGGSLSSGSPITVTAGEDSTAPPVFTITTASSELHNSSITTSSSQ